MSSALNIFLFMGLLAGLVSCTSLSVETKVSPEERKKNIAILKTQLAVEFVNIKDYRSAVRSINEAVTVDPRYAYAWMVKGIVYQHIKDTVTASSAYQKALSLDIKNAEINNNYGWFICNDLKDPDKSLTYFDKALKDLTYPTPELAYMNKGICLGKMSKYAEAERNLNKAMLLNPNFIYTVLELSRLKYRQGQYNEAKHYFDNYQHSVETLRAQDLLLGYEIASRLGRGEDKNKYLLELRAKYPQSEETLKLSY